MSRSTPSTEFRSRWMNWTPEAVASPDQPKHEPSKPTKASCDGFEGSYSAHIQKIESQPDSAALARARAVLDAAGVIALEVDGVKAMGVWSDLDSSGIREALRAIRAGDLRVRYLDAPATPDRFKSRWVRGEAAPLSVLVAMEGSPEPWKVRDTMLTEMGWRASRG